MRSRVLALGDICDFVYGAGLPESKRKGGGVPVYGSNGFVGWHNSAITRGPTIIIGRKGSIGEVHFSTVSCWPIDTTYYIEKTKIPCNIRWLFYGLLTLNLPAMNKAAAIPGLNRTDAYERSLFSPSIPEQERITAILDKADRLRRLRRYSRDLSDTYLQSVFLGMFGDPVKNPMGWEVVTLKELGKLDRGRSKHRPRNAPELYRGAYPFIQTGDVANATGYIRKFSQTYSDIGLKQSKLWPSGTMCITIAANIARTAVITFDACFPDSIVGFTPNDRTNVEFVQNWFSFMQKNLEDIAPESAQKNINLEILKKLDVALPPKLMQERFAKIVQRFERLRAQQRETERQAEHLFQTLLHKAFKGELG